VAGAVVTAVLVTLVTEYASGRQATAADAWQQVRPRLLPIVGVSLAISLVVLGLFVLLDVPVLFWSLWGEAVPALLLRPRMGQVRGYSAKFHAEDVWRGILVRLISFLVGTLVLAAVIFPFWVAGSLIAEAADVPAADSRFVAVAIAVASILGAAIVKPFRAGAVALFHLDRRLRREGLDIVEQLRLRQPRRPPSDAVGGRGGVEVLGVADPRRPARAAPAAADGPGVGVSAS
jgi:hypothetical protein